MADDKVLIIMTSGPDTPRRCATPFFFASLAAAMEYEVTMFFTIDGTLLLKKGMAETIYPKAGGKPVRTFSRMPWMPASTSRPAPPPPNCTTCSRPT